MNFNRISRDPKIMNGQPCIRGTRLTVSRVLDALSAYPDRAERFRNYPELDDKTMTEVLAYSAAAVDDRLIDLVDAQ